MFIIVSPMLEQCPTCNLLSTYSRSMIDYILNHQDIPYGFRLICCHLYHHSYRLHRHRHHCPPPFPSLLYVSGALQFPSLPPPIVSALFPVLKWGRQGRINIPPTDEGAEPQRGQLTCSRSRVGARTGPFHCVFLCHSTYGPLPWARIICKWLLKQSCFLRCSLRVLHTAPGTW